MPIGNKVPAAHKYAKPGLPTAGTAIPQSGCGSKIEFPRDEFNSNDYNKREFLYEADKSAKKPWDK